MRSPSIYTMSSSANMIPYIITSFTHLAATQYVCVVRTQLGVNQKILSIRKESMLSGFLTLNAQSIESMYIIFKKWSLQIEIGVHSL